MAVSARSNRALSQFWGMVLLAMTCLLIGLELAAAPARKLPPPEDRQAGNPLVTRQNAGRDSQALPTTG